MISVLMGVYNRRNGIDLLKRAVDSILAQRDVQLELLICDDGSSIETLRYLDQCAGEDPRVILVRPGNAFPLPQKLNDCIKCSRGDFFARMDDDDYSYPDRLRKQLRYLQEHPDVSFVGSAVNLLCDGCPVGIRLLPERPSVRDFYLKQPYIHPTLVFRRSVLEAVNGYNEAPYAERCEDYDLLLRIYRQGFYGANLPEVLLDYSVRRDPHDDRTLVDRWHETVMRYLRFRDLDCLAAAFPYVLKPLAVWALPGMILNRLKRRSRGNSSV